MSTPGSSEDFLVTIIKVYGMILASLWLTMIVHELGHYVMARRYRYKILTAFVWPIGFDFREGRTRVRLWSTKGIGGGVFFEVPDPFDFKLHVRVIAAGIGAQLISIVAVALLMAAVPTTRIFGFTYIVISGLVAFINALPLEKNGFLYDGKAIYWLLKEPEKYAALIKFASGYQDFMVKRSPEYMPEPLETEESWIGEKAFVRLCRYWSLLDKKQVYEAEAEIRSALADVEVPNTPVHLQRVVWAEAAFYFTRYIDDRPTAHDSHEKFKKISPKMPTPSYDVAFKFRRGDLPGARRDAEKYLNSMAVKTQLPKAQELTKNWYAMILDESLPTRPVNS